MNNRNSMILVGFFQHLVKTLSFFKAINPFVWNNNAPKDLEQSRLLDRGMVS